ncbi:BppU family phage baseplate upper protein [Clostridium sp. K25]|uniref:BppU family phage baseplate upper protein n=1 Tax=Clostridium sp. K25 TaxID=1443109 RepID=UPI00069E0370|nr:BppU family phage baseplate upper protein [Clostridium sp. K25]
MDKIFNLRIDSKVGNINIVQGLKQFENNAILNITLLQNSLALDLTNCSVRINFLREDKKVMLYMADIVNAREGKVSIKLSPEVLRCHGTVKCDISVFDSNLLKITSATFNMKVDESIYSNDYYLNMKDFDIVQRMHIEEEKRIANENKRVESESARITDEKKRSNTEALRNEKENERISNEEKRVKAESKRNEDEHTRSEAENKRKECESNRIDQEKIRIENEKTRVEAEDKRKISENTRVDNELGRITYEAERATNEEIRIQSELNRVENEKLRSEAEDKRLEAEKLRVEKEAERINQEGKRNTAENTRVNNETNRVKAEKTRVEEWNKIKNTFKDNAPGDMKSIVYDKNGNGKVDIAELAESIEWDNVKNKPDFSELGKVKSVNSKTGDVILKAKDITTENGTNLEELNSQYEDFTNEIGNIKDLKTINKDNLVSALNEVFTSADNGKKSIYNSIVGKKVTPKSKDFKDLTDAITDIKLGQGNAQASDVLSGKTFTNDSGIVQTGSMKNYGVISIEPSKISNIYDSGYYKSIIFKPITAQNIESNFQTFKPENIKKDVNIAGIVGTYSGESEFIHFEKINTDNDQVIFKSPIDLPDEYEYSLILRFKINSIKYGGSLSCNGILPIVVSSTCDNYKLNKNFFNGYEALYAEPYSKSSGYSGYNLNICVTTNELNLVLNKTREGAFDINIDCYLTKLKGK